MGVQVKTFGATFVANSDQNLQLAMKKVDTAVNEFLKTHAERKTLDDFIIRPSVSTGNDLQSFYIVTVTYFI